jgi:sugar (pentulose or hexulose) kinase
MDRNKVIAVFDIGKTNKKILLFDNKLNVVFQSEEKFQTTTDEDGFECDDIELIVNWMRRTLEGLLLENGYEITAVNFSTYGASLAFLDKDGNRLSPIYNYMKEVPLSVQENLFEKHGGQDEFCRKTASPALGVLLNSGIQVLWMKREHPDLFQLTESILHFPQYLSYTLTGKIVSEFTSIGCHTFLWDFDKMQYHSWLGEEQVILPEPLPNSHAFSIDIAGKPISVGIGIHDSSASLAPYILGSEKKFLLVSTGTWCINMNPYNHSPLTAHQLNSDCLSYLSIDQKPVKSSRLFMGQILDVNVDRIAAYFAVGNDSYKGVACDENLICSYLKHDSLGEQFFMGGVPEEYIDMKVDLSKFSDFSEAYHRLMYDLTALNKQSIDLVSEDDDGVENIYVSGGFARNEIFVRLLASFYPGKSIYTTEVDNSSALGAALVVHNADPSDETLRIDLGLKAWTAF